MSAIDYLCCKKCHKKIFYDEHQDLLDYLETYHESKGLMCPDCSEQLERELAEARAEIERLDHQRRAAWTEIKRKDALSEQMYEAIKFSLIADEVRQTKNVCASDINNACETSRLKRVAALEAAERAKK